MAENPAATHDDTAHDRDGWPQGSLEQRVRRLEDAVASLQDTNQVEERVVERVTARLQNRPVPSEHVSERPLAPQPAAAPEAPRPEPTAPLLNLSALPSPDTIRHAWLFIDVLAELRAMVRMVFDVRYHVAWTARLTVLVLVPFILTSHWWLPVAGVPVIGPILDKLLGLVLAFFVYKALSREAQRYRQMQAARRAGAP
jgi:hypothetical protein